MTQTEKSDRVRRAVVLLTVAGSLVAAVIGSGLVGGTSIADAAGGAFAADATVLAPAGFAFSIWSVIYLGLLAYAIWQAVPAQAAKPRHRAVGYGVAASALLNAVWIVCVLAWRIAESFVIIVLLLCVLLATFVRACRSPQRRTVAELVLIDGVIGLYLGWVTVAAAANLAAWLADIGISAWSEAPGVPGTLTLIAAGLVALFTAWRGGRWAPAVATAWGLVWIAVGRWAEDPAAPVVASTAIVLAVLVVLLAAWRFRARTRVESADAAREPAAAQYATER
ncbi:tryptophan-rich sensory protein [Microbacterium sp. YMB-B2]|uniref:Tryptophan-rich sensory protein n=1 Tax=Microbacterium tenebrionis TaxID=2830665 RepID=A0A9X1RZ26_9MICO|nr:tryptophan-rich sensory protein [Microbacterium tenebrionis]MCC2028304.1 tryptophan-rich sensory protein [Microbacterium tenebrionis]